MALCWKKDPPEIGLASRGAGPRGSSLYGDGLCYATVSALRNGPSVLGWYWVASWDSDIPYKNTASTPVKTEQEAKDAATKYVKHHLNRHAR